MPVLDKFLNDGGHLRIVCLDSKEVVMTTRPRALLCRDVMGRGVCVQSTKCALEREFLDSSVRVLRELHDSGCTQSEQHNFGLKFPRVTLTRHNPWCFRG